jgi:hypothetical protein
MAKMTPRFQPVFATPLVPQPLGNLISLLTWRPFSIPLAAIGARSGQHRHEPMPVQVPFCEEQQ